MTNERNGTLYIGVTNNLARRVWEHQQRLYEGFSKKYQLKMLVYYETHDSIESAIAREKAMKKWPRQKKLDAIAAFNFFWHDLSKTLNA